MPTRRRTNTARQTGTTHPGGMSHPLDPAIDPVSPWQTRAAVILLCGLITLAIFFAYAGPSWFLASYRLLDDGGITVLWALSAAGIGWAIWKPASNPAADPIHPALALVSCFALGSGIISLLMLAMGLAGLLNHAIVIVIVAVGLCCASACAIVHRNRWNPNQWLAAKASWDWLWIAVMPLLSIALIGAMFPAGLLWGDEPNGYDVTEYHLQVPREWYEAGKIIPLHHNVFSYLPFNMEMHYLLAMYLRGGPWAGMYVAQLMHVAFCVATIFAIFGLAGGGAKGIISAALAAALPWITLLAPVAYVEGGLLLFGTLAIGWAMRGKTARQFIFAGAMAGFAAGVKLTAAPMIIAAVPVALLVARRRAGLSGAAIFFLAAMVTFSPWLIRNQVWAKNPVFPEAMTILGKAHFSDVQVERWNRANAPNAEHRSLVGHFTGFGSQVLWDWRYGYVLIPLALIAVGVAVRTVFLRSKQPDSDPKTAFYLAVMLLILTIIWIGFTHLQSRFYVLAIPICALLIAEIIPSQDAALVRSLPLVLRGRVRVGAELRLPGQMVVTIAATLLTILLAISSLFQLHPRIMKYINYDRQVSLIGRENLTGLKMDDPSKFPPDATFALVGDAEVFLYPIPMTRLFYKTVFDVDTTNPHASIEEAWLMDCPFKPTHVQEDKEELERFHKTYYAIPAP